MIGAVQRRRVAVLAGCHAVDDLYQGAVPALLPFFVADRGYSYAAAAGLVFAQTALSSVAQPVFGILTDRHHLYWLVPVGLGTAGVCVGMSGVVSGYGLTFAMIVLAGIGVAAFHPEAARAARVAAGHSQQAMSGFSVGGNVGIALGPLAVAAVFFLAGRRTIAATGYLMIPAVATAVVVFVLLRRQAAATPAGARAAPTATAGGDDWRRFSLLSSVVVVRSVVNFGLTSLVALYVGTQLGEGKFVGEVALTTLLVGGAVGTVVGGRLADRFGRVPVTRLSLAASAPCLAVTLVVPGLWVLLPIAVTGVVMFLSFSLTVTLGQDYLPNRVGTSSGVTLGLAFSIGGLLAPALGALADATSLRLALVVVLPLLPLAAGLAWRLPDPRLEPAVVAPQPGTEGAKGS